MPAVEKRFNVSDPYAADRYEREKALLSFFSTHGLAPNVISADDEARSLVMEYVPHKTVGAIGDATVGAELFGELPVILDAVARMHAQPLDSLPDMLRQSALLDAGKMAFYGRELIPAVTQYAARESAVADALSERQISAWLGGAVGVLEEYEPVGKTFIHADLHISNILRPANGVRFIDFGKARIGDPAYDISYFCARTASARFLDLDRSTSFRLFGETVKQYAQLASLPERDVAAAAWCAYLYDTLEQFSIVSSIHLIKPESRGLFYCSLDNNLATLGHLYENDFQLENVAEST